jgi:serine/threonine protein kinase
MSDVLSAGHVIAGRYRLVRRLGEGGMGTVWLADHVTLHSKVAIKLLHSAGLDSEDGLKRFLREAQAAAQLRSPHVVQILEHGVDEGIPFIAMELLEGESLATRLARLSTLSVAQTARIVTHVARAIGKAHEAGIVHRDLKPDNIFIVHNDDEEMVKVLDFGIAKMDRAAVEPVANISTQEGSLLGTPHYMSPEQVRGHGVDWRSDLWSLAIIAFECVCGRLPFEGRTIGDIMVVICSEPLPVPSTLRPLSPAFDAWFAKATTRDVAGRFQSAKEMAEALRAAVDDESKTPLSAPTSEPAKRVVPDDAQTLDARVSARSELEQARTVSTGGTMGGAAKSSEVQAPTRRVWPLIGGACVVAALGVGVWVSGLTRLPPVAKSSGTMSALPQVSVAVPEPSPSLAPEVVSTSPITSSVAMTSASAVASGGHVTLPPKASASAATHPSKHDTKSGDELLF